MTRSKRHAKCRRHQETERRTVPALEASSLAWTDVCLALPTKLTERDTITGRSTEVSAALQTAATQAKSLDGRNLAADLQRRMATRADRNEFVRIRPDDDPTTSATPTAR